MITTVTLSPSLDTVVVVGGLRIGEVNRSEKVFSYAGGKGIDVSRTVKQLGGNTCALGIVAGNNGRSVRRFLDEETISHDFLEVDGNTRNNILLECRDEKTETIILHRDDYRIDPAIPRELQDRVRQYAGRSNVMVLAGSVPSALPAFIYRDLVATACREGCQTILDSSGAALRAGLEAAPHMIKPNREEMEQLSGKTVRTVDEAVAALPCLDSHGVGLVVVSLGDQGAVLKHEGRIFVVEPLNAPVISYAGAGDSLVGGVALGISKGADLKESIAMGVAAATATLSEYGSSFFSREQYEHFKLQVKIREV